MQKRCPNGHVYDSNIYGDQCPICPVGVSAPAGSGPATQLGGGYPSSGIDIPIPPSTGGRTHIATGIPGGQMQSPANQPSYPPANDPTGETKIRPQSGSHAAGGHTVIRHAKASGQVARGPVRKLVGFLVTYNRDPNGKAFNLYEGRNFIGRDSSCDICIADDDQLSGRHLSILYRNVDNKFKFRDEQSSNGTFINKELLDDGTLENYDIIRAGSTIFIFIAIPNIS